MEFFCCPAALVQMVSVLWNIEHPMYVWDDDASCFITSYDEEDSDQVEFYLPPNMVHWHNNCPQEPQAYEQLVPTANKQRASA
eukprot:10387753-Prorocentrum_lima.AAC.1